ncbi:MAG: imidazolonepropionase [Pseudomonadota bacterium]
MNDTVCIHNARVYGRPEDARLDVVMQQGVITAIEPTSLAPVQAQTIDAEGRVLIPGLIDGHTHACFAGSRLDEWEQSLAGADYLELLAAGGGIMSTVRATRAASQDELADALLQRLMRMLAQGSTTIEVKSGYGLDTEHELKMLRAIEAAAMQFPGTVCATACIGHALDPAVDRNTFIERTLHETLPAVSEAFPGIALDAYCETGAWSLAECTRLFDAGQAAGHPIRVHADQFHSLGMIETAVTRGYTSVDLLEASSQTSLRRLAQSNTVGVMLPAAGFHLDDRYANGRAFLDAGGRLALGSNYNPGSAPCYSMPFVIQLAVRKLGLTIDEAIAASTVHGAALLGFTDRGQLQVGQRADMVLLDEPDVRALAFEFGAAPIARVICAGQVQAMATRA